MDEVMLAAFQDELEKIALKMPSKRVKALAGGVFSRGRKSFRHGVEKPLGKALDAPLKLTEKITGRSLPASRRRFRLTGGVHPKNPVGEAGHIARTPLRALTATLRGGSPFSKK